jgi:hypothetical protein
VEGPLVLGPVGPVGVGPLDRDLTLLDQTIEDLDDIQFVDLGFLDADGDVVEVDKNSDLVLLVHIVIIQFSPPSIGVPARPLFLKTEEDASSSGEISPSPIPSRGIHCWTWGRSPIEDRLSASPKGNRPTHHGM